MDELIQFLKELEGQRFYGSVEIKMEAGKVVIIRETQTLKPGERRSVWSQSRIGQSSM